MQIKKCQISDCPLAKKKEVPYSGNKKAKLLLCGESPGVQEVKLGKPFVGDSGDLLKEICATIGLDWASLFIVNSARCMIYKKEMSGKAITQTLAYCRPYLVRAINVIKPKGIIVAGDFALRQLTRRSGVTKHRGKWIWSEEFNCWLLPVFHPVYILRNPGLRQKLVDDLKQAKAFLDNDCEPVVNTEILNYQEVQSIKPVLEQKELSVSVDTEGQGLDWTDPDYIMMSYSVSWLHGQGVSIRLFDECPVEEADIVFPWPRPVEGKKKKELVDVGVKRSANFKQKLQELWALLESSNIRKYMMNGSFDRHVFNITFRREFGGVPTVRRYVMDIQAAAHVIDENLYLMASLDELQRSFTDYGHDYNQEFDQKYDKSDMLAVPADEVIPYACADTDVTLRVANELRTILLKGKNRKQARYFVRFVMPALSKILFALEENGAYIDQDELPKAMIKVEELMNAASAIALKNIKKSVRSAHKEKGLRLTRDDLVRDALFDEDGFALDVIKRTAGGAPSVDKGVRALLLEKKLTKKCRTFLEQFNLFSEYHTLWSRYLKGFKKHIKKDGRIHSSLSLTTAVTGRVASSKPNMMNIPKRSKSSKIIRKLIKAAPGYLLMAADEAQSELRWMAALSGDQEMARVFRCGEDIHTNTAKALTQKSWASLSKDDIDMARRNAKSVNFGLLYLISVNGFIKYAKREYRIELTFEQGEAWVKTFFRMYKRIPTYHRKTIEFCRQYGYVESVLGRRRHLPEIWSKDDFIRGGAERMAVNHPIQNPSSDIVLMAGNEIADQGHNPEEFRPILFIHDELIYEVKDNSKVIDYGKILKEAMENPPLERNFGYKMPIPLVSDVKVGHTLVELKDLDLTL